MKYRRNEYNISLIIILRYCDSTKKKTYLFENLTIYVFVETFPFFDMDLFINSRK